MAVDREQARKDTAAKLELEAELRPKIRASRKALVKKVVRTLGRTGELPDVDLISSESLEPILLAHYEKVGKAFSGTIGARLPDDVKATSEEVEEIAENLATHFQKKAPIQAREIAGTDGRNARTSRFIAEEEIRRLRKEEDREPSREEEALIVGTILGRQLESRLSRIAIRETQTTAETSKLAEVQVLLDLKDLGELSRSRAPAVERVTEPLRKPIKEWVSQGDSSVRTPPDSAFDHLRADSGQVPVDEPFIVSGEKLMYPGDESLGASKGNLMGCRCSSVVDVKEIASARMRVAEEVPEPPPEAAPEVAPKPKEDAKTSLEKWTDAEGNWLPERVELHDEIVDHFTKNAVPVPEGEEKIFHMVAGGTASGKGTAIGSGQINTPPRHVKIDADEIKAKFPEYQEMIAGMDPKAAGYIHLESSHVSERIMQRSVELNSHVVLDGVGDGGIEKVTRRVKRFADQGYKVKADYVTVPTDVALERAHIRSLSGKDKGRKISPTVTKGLHKGVSQDFPEAAAADLFEELHLYDTNIPVGQPARPVFSKIKGEEAVIHDQTLWEEFLAKARE